MIVKTEAIVLKSFDYRETSRIARFFTRDFGKVSGIFKGIRKDPKKFRSNIDRFSVNEMVYYCYTRSDLHLVSHCELKEFFFPIRNDYKKNVAANYALELVDTIMQQEEENVRVYQLLLDFLSSLSTAIDVDKLIYMFQIKILHLSGFSPHLDACVKCDQQIQQRARFSMQSGGLLCTQCPTTELSFTAISPGTVASILHFEQNIWNDALRLGLTSSVRKELKFILNNFLVYHLEKKIKTSKYLLEV